MNDVGTIQGVIERRSDEDEWVEHFVAHMLDLDKVRVVNIHGQTALMHAIQSHAPLKLVHALACVSDVLAQDEDGWTALMYTVKSNREGVVQLMHNHEARARKFKSVGVDVDDIPLCVEESDD